MVTPIAKSEFNGNTVAVYVCISTDTLPAADNGSIAIEMNTGKTYFYDYDGGVWRNKADGSARS